MAIFYLLHSLPWGEGLSAGQRNCRTFLFGAFLYLCVYLVIANCHLKWTGFNWAACYTALALMFLADSFVMGYLYKYQYGRNLLEEVGDDSSRYVYDSQNQRYRKLGPDELLERDLETVRKMEQLITTYEQERNQAQKEGEAKQRLIDILTHREEIRAAKTIQRWWRDKLYRPGTGILYLRGKARFESLM